MSREIKYRQAVYSLGKFSGWHYWGYVDGDNTFNCPVHGESQQFTGLKDKTGKEIYEGDILALSNVLIDGDKKTVKAVMDGWQSLFVSLEGGFYCQMGETAQNYREVIGNIYENKELMEAVK